jgi:DNA-binding transcriptional ArsR family regulator
MVQSKSYDLDLIFHAFSDPTRRAILKKLSRSEKSIVEVAKPFQMSLTAVAKHVKVLEKAKLISRRREGSSSYLKLNDPAMATAEEWISHYRRYWQEQLDSFQKFIEEDSK